MFPEVLVNAAGFVMQDKLTWSGRLVTAATVIVQDAVELAIETAENAIVSGMPCVTSDVPLQPAPNVTTGVALVNLRLAGRLSVKAIPACAGLVPEFVSVNTRFVGAPSSMVATDHAFVSVAC